MDFHELIEGQVRECYGRVVYSHKTHEKCADILLGRLGTIKLCQIVLSSITTAGFIATILGAGPVGAVVGVVVSTILLVLNAYTKDHDLGELAQKHAKQPLTYGSSVRNTSRSSQIFVSERSRSKGLQPAETR